MEPQSTLSGFSVQTNRASCVFVERKQKYYLLNNKYLEEVYRIMGNDIETSEIL